MNDLFSNIEKGNGKEKSDNATKAAAEASGPKPPYREYNGTIEKSKVIYDEFGRQSIRVDFSDHGMPLEHSVPHIHEYLYGPGLSPTKGFEFRYNY
ncbi:hypothetical protein QJV14_11180 [Listeria cossartiae subsp. cayugensis]|uniref:hypothetical protein n=1 Tax=Listeria cossartiae TaxID=2838249 RepID=UPI002880B922|nr:hypothetical protein [Listeria cossartiae]MDT0003987.1 hypothetical protein [Listeria cossartiae subsp. cayugensis]MDT0020381.1 hypothetical protein [Listeria cossartiae subsp. cayugensis]MDT0036404.1 hypothetical protein [Listeria cossartiae subsp. cayugensis]MDT0042132.1 hypothetical protein [Listeria cossartiae subsp. cayugensis]MDT0047483.1 hypothetical protein [Listeria cossartiae subsp. cayugensis]